MAFVHSRHSCGDGFGFADIDTVSFAMSPAGRSGTVEIGTRRMAVGAGDGMEPLGVGREIEQRDSEPTGSEAASGGGTDAASCTGDDGDRSFGGHGGRSYD